MAKLSELIPVQPESMFTGRSMGSRTYCLVRWARRKAHQGLVGFKLQFKDLMGSRASEASDSRTSKAGHDPDEAEM